MQSAVSLITQKIITYKTKYAVERVYVGLLEQYGHCFRVYNSPWLITRDVVSR